MEPNEVGLRALFIVPIDAPGGAERVMAAAAVDLTRRLGWSVHVVSLGARLEHGFLDQLGGGVTVSYGKGGGYAPSEWGAVLGLAGQSFDLAFASHFRVNVALATARRLGLVKFERLVTRESTVFGDRYAWPRRSLYHALYRLYGPQDLIVAQTAYMGDRLREMLPAAARGKVQVAPNPVDTEAIRAAAAAPLDAALSARLSSRPHIAWCGRLIDIKQPLLALDVIAELRRTRGRDLGLAMIGAGPLKEEISRRAELLGVADALTLTGHMLNPYPALAACRYGLLTSRREGFPNVLLEMMALGIETIATTPCSGDLDTLEGIELVEANAQCLAEPFAAEKPDSQTRTTLYQKALQKRTPQALVNVILGIK